MQSIYSCTFCGMQDFIIYPQKCPSFIIEPAWCSRFQLVLEGINNVLGVPDSYAAKNWPITAIFSKDLVAMLRLLVALARRFAPDVRLPSNCQLTRVIVRKLNGVLQHRRQVEVVTEATDTTGRQNRVSELYTHATNFV